MVTSWPSYFPAFSMVIVVMVGFSRKTPNN